MMSWKWIPRVIALLLLWGGVVAVVMWVDPRELSDVLVPGLYLPMVSLVTLSVWYSGLLLTKSFKAASLLALIVVVAVVTMIYRLMNALIAISLVGMTVSLGLTLVKKS